MAGDATNIALDPLFIFVFRMGVTGAAIAHVISQYVLLCYDSNMDLRSTLCRTIMFIVLISFRFFFIFSSLINVGI